MNETEEHSASSMIQSLILSFFSGMDIQQVGEINLSWDEQRTFLDLTLLHPLVQQYPMNRDYCKVFLRYVIKTLEKSSEYVHDKLYEIYCTLLQENTELSLGFGFKHYLIKDDVNQFITIKESSNLILDGTTGLRTWEAAVVLADWALSNKDMFHGKRVLELGSGLGLTGLVIAKNCDPASFCFSDCHPRVLGVLQENIHINFPKTVKTIVTDDHKEACIRVLTLDWNNAEDALNDNIPDVVIGADIVYDPSVFPALCNVFNTVFTLNKDVEIYLISTIRNEETSREFIQQLYQHNFGVHHIDYKSSCFIYWNERQQYQIIKIHKYPPRFI